MATVNDYTRTTWQTGDVIDATKMNNIETQLDAVTDNARENGVAPVFSTTKTYAVGEHVLYNGEVYRCKTAVASAGAWVANNWTKASLSEDLEGEVSELKSAFTTNVGAIADIYPKVNLFNNGDTGNITGQGKYIKNDGTIGAVGSSGYAYTCLIPIELNTVYAFKSASGYGTNRGKVFLYDDSGNYIETIESVNPFNTAVRVFEITNAAAKYIRLNTTDTMIETLMLVRGIDYPDEYVEYSLHAEIKGEVAETLKTYKTENLFNKDDPRNKVDTYISSSGVDTILSGSGYMCSNYIPIQNNKTYCYKTSATYGTAQANAFIYDKYGQFIEKITGTLNGNINVITISNTDAVYLRINYIDVIANSEMVVEGNSYPTDYIAFRSGYQLKDGVLISDEQYAIIMQKIAEASGTVSGNPLSGKKAAYAGDSICYGYGYTGGYAKIIAENNDMTFSNVAVSGAKLVGDIVGQLSSLPNDADYYIIEGGYNDYAAGNYTLGEIQNWGYAIDETTITGAIQYIFRYLYNNFPGKKYGFIFPHRIPQYGSSWDTTYRPAIKEALKKWGIPYIDLTDNALPIAMNSTWRDAYTDNGDGIHPNRTGYETWYVPKITAWMKTL